MANLIEKVFIDANVLVKGGFFIAKNIISFASDYNKTDAFVVEATDKDNNIFEVIDFYGSPYVEYYIKVLKKDILINFKDYSNDIKEIYELYDSEKYRLCILSLINILSQIFNKSFEGKDFTETDEIVLKNYNIMNLSNEEYYQFMPYCRIYDGKKVKKYDNALLNNYKNKREKYADFPYNRNAILHGYSNDFGNKNNCLRWFSVLLNTNDIFEYNK